MIDSYSCVLKPDLLYNYWVNKNTLMWAKPLVGLFIAADESCLPSCRGWAWPCSCLIQMHLSTPDNQGIYLTCPPLALSGHEPPPPAHWSPQHCTCLAPVTRPQKHSYWCYISYTMYTTYKISGLFSVCYTNLACATASSFRWALPTCSGGRNLLVTIQTGSVSIVE